MASSHTVRQGETVARIAYERGFRLWQTLWNAPENEELSRRRASPDVLQPGDLLQIPDPELRVEPCATARRHIFVAEPRPVERIILHVEDVEGRPLEGLPFRLILGNIEVAGSTGPAGRIDEAIPFGLRWATLEFNDLTWRIAIGALDPVADPDAPQPVSGGRQRLENLAYGSGLACLPREEALRAATVSFDHAVRGRVDPARLTCDPPSDGGLDQTIRSQLQRIQRT